MRAPWFVVLVACSSPANDKLPGASIAPQLRARTTAAACGTDISFDGSSRVDVAYRYAYDDLRRLAFARGRYANGIEDTIEYEWDNLDHMVHSLHTRAADGVRVEIAAQYSTLGDLLEYTWTQTTPRSREESRYVYSGFTDIGQPTRQQVTEQGEQVTYQLDYDALGRIARVAPETGGLATIYTYDDDARTIIVDTGAYRGVITYDEANRQLSESWDGSDPAAIAKEQVFEWSGDRLLAITYRSGGDFTPHELRIVEVDTYRYHCPQ